MTNDFDLSGLGMQDACIGNTPLIELDASKGVNRHRVFAKCEYKNPTGSHYDRVYARLFSAMERSGEITRGVTPLVEASSGNAAASFAWFCAQLGYPCTIFLPRRIPETFVAHIATQNPKAQIVIADLNCYLKGAVHTMQRFLVTHRDHKCMNHSRRPETLAATATIATEALEQVHHQFGLPSFDRFIAACGNGATIVGPGPVLKRANPALDLVIFEPAVAPVAAPILESTSASCPEGGFQYHPLYGTGAWGVAFPFLTKPAFGFRRLVTKHVLMSSSEIEESLSFHAEVGFPVGNTSLAALHLARKLAVPDGSSTLIILYDDGRKYGRGSD